MSDNHHVMPRYRQQPITTDPIDRWIAEREAEEARAKAKVEAGTHLQPDPADLRGIPCLAKGTSSTIARTSPHGEAQAGRMDNHRLNRRHTVRPHVV